MKDYGTIPNTSGSFPAVEAENATGSGATDGTPFIKQLIDDAWGARQALMDYCGLTPDGVQESASASQFLDCLKQMVARNLTWIANWEKLTPAGAYAGTFLSAVFGDTDQLWCIGGDNGEIQTSPTGDVWTARTAAGGFSGIFHAADYKSGLFLLVGGTAAPVPEIQTSPDGITWTSRTPGGGFATGVFLGAANDGTTFVIVGYDGTTTPEIQTSPDGITWTSRTPAAGADVFVGVAYGAGLFVAVGNGTGASTAAIQTSPDGITWTARSYPGTVSEFEDVFYHNGLFVAVGNAGQIYTSPDGITWTAQSSPVAVALYTVCGGNRGWVIGGNGVLLTSPDAINWKQRKGRPFNFSGAYGEVAYGNDMMIIVGATGEIERSLKHE